MVESKYENIPVITATKIRVDDYGRKGQTYDEIVLALLEKAKKFDRLGGSKK